MGYTEMYSGDVIYTAQIGVERYSQHGLYSTWRMMNVRCYDARHKAYHRYGGRGITVAEEWRWDNSYGFFNFLKDVGKRPENMTLDRIDNDKPYSPENCRWATKREQQNNIGIGVKNKFGVLGVTLNKGAFVAQGSIGSEHVYIGVYNTLEEASEAYNQFQKIKMEEGDYAALEFLNDENFFRKTPVGKNISRNKTSKYFGVCWSKSRKSWRAYYTHRVNGKLKQKHIGFFADEDEAGRAVECYIEEVMRGQI